MKYKPIYVRRLFFGLLSICIISCAQKQPAANNGIEKGSRLPAIQLLLKDSTSNINTAELKGGRPMILLYFSPDCPYCQAQIEEITKNMNDLKNISFYFLTGSSYREMMWLYNHFQLNRYSNITVGVDYNQDFTKYFQVPGVPYMAVFDRNKQLNETFLGKTSVNKIKKVAAL